MKSVGKYQSTRLIRIVEIEQEHMKHRKRLAEIRSVVKFDRQQELRQQKHQHRQLKKRRKAAKNFRLKLDQDRIQHQNGLLHDHLKKVYTRNVSSTHELSREELKPTLSQRSTIMKKVRTEARREIEHQNLRIHEKLIGVQSQLNKDRFDEDYSNICSIRSRLQSSSPRKHQTLRQVIKQKFHIVPSVMLPHIKRRKRGFMDTQASSHRNPELTSNFQF